MGKFTNFVLTFALLVAGVGGVTAQSKYLKLGNVLSLSDVITASSSTGFAIVYNDSKLLTVATSGSPTISCVDIADVTRGYIFKLTAKRATVSEVDYYRIECFNPNNTLVAAGDDCGEYGDNILSPVSWGDIWSSTVVSKTADESGDGNAYSSDEWDGRDFKYGAQWCFESDGAGGYYIKTRADGSTKPYVSSSGQMTNAEGKASFKFYSLVAKDYSTLNFNASGVATIDLTSLEVSGDGVSFDSTSGEITSENPSGMFYLLFDNEDFTNVSTITVNVTTSGTYTDITNNGGNAPCRVIDAVNGTINSWYNSRFNINLAEAGKGYQAKSGNITKIEWDINGAGSMKINSITVQGDVLSASDDPSYWVDLTKEMYNISDCAINLSKDEGTVVYGRTWNFTLDNYADITGYQKLKITGTAGTVVRFFINSTVADSRTIESDGTLTIDFSTDVKYKDATYIHLCNIRPNSSSTANISSIKLYSPHLSGSGKILDSAQGILNDVKTTSIDATGITAATVLTIANPNCLFTANDGMVTNDNNVVVSDACAQLAISDGYPFKAPAAFTATAAPTYDRTFTASATTTVCLPFALTAAEAATLGTFYELSSFDGSTLRFTSVDAPEANKPYLVVPTSTSLTLSQTGKSIAATPVNLGTKASDAEFIGTLTTTDIPASSEGDGKYSYYAYNSGSLVKVVTIAAKLPAFRAYFKVLSTAISAARSLNISFDNEATGISAALMNSDERTVKSEVYNLNGQRVAAPQKGLYIVNGKKVIVK